MENRESAQTSALTITCGRPDSSRIKELVRQRITRLAECIRKDGAPYPLTAQLVNVWVDVFVRAQATPEQAEAAFDKAERHIKFWPSPGEVLEFVSQAEGNAAEEESAKKWDVVLAYAMRRSPDIPEKNPPKISEHTRRAINAAGGLDWIRDCPAKELPWARTRFIEAYARYGELQQEQFLLPEGEAKSLLTGAAQKFLPPADVYEEGRARSIAHSGKLKSSGCNQPELRRAMRAIVEQAQPHPPARSIDEQKEILRTRGLLK